MLMLLFAVSITPQRTLHDIFGCHTDVAASADAHDLQLKAYKLSCCCNQADLHAPFAEPTILFTNLIAKPVANLVNYDILSLCKQSILNHALRGPPACVSC